MELNELFYYENGRLFNKITRNSRALAGNEAGNLGKAGYLKCQVEGKTWSIHRLVYTLLKGEITDGLHIDHINGDKLDNRIENLRLVTNQENHFNRAEAKGFSWDKSKGKWKARLIINGKFKALGHYDTILDARAAYLRAKRELHTIEKR